MTFRTSTKHPRGLGLSLGLAAALVLTVGAAGVAASAVGNVTAGKKIFQSNCAACHQPDASGGVEIGDAKSADLRAPELEKMYHETDKLLERAIMDGKDEDGDVLNAVMPRWRSKLSKAQVDDVIAYLKTVTK